MQTASRLRSPSDSPKARVNPLRASALGAKPSGVPIPSNVTPVRRTLSRGPVPLTNTNRSSSASPNRIPAGPKSPSFSTPLRRSSPTGVSTSVAGRLTSTPVLQRLIVEDDEVRVDADMFEVGSDRSPAVGGAVGLWKLSREAGGNSPTRLRSPTAEEPVVSASTPLVRGIRDASRAASEALTYSPHRVGPTSTTVNSSLDTAKMGSVLRPPPTAPTSSQRSMDGLTPTSRSVTTSSSITSVSKAAKRPSTFATAPRGLLIPPLELPTLNIATTTNTQDGSPSTTEHHTREPGWVTVVFDLDETLCNNRRMGKAALRPGCMELLHRLAKIRDDPEANCFIEIILWTASMECVARPVTDGMDPNGTLFNHCIFRDRRWYKEVGYTKDLRLLGRDLSHVVIIENSPQSVVLNRRHAILVKDYVGHGPNATTIGGYSSFLGRYFSGNSATATASPTDPSLYIVADILCDWALKVGESAKTIVPRAPTGFNHIHSTLDPGCVPLPPALGIVEFLRTRRDMNASNEVVIDATNKHLGGDGASPEGVVGRAPQRAASSPAGAPHRGGYAVGRWRRGM